MSADLVTHLRRQRARKLKDDSHRASVYVGLAAVVLAGSEYILFVDGAETLWQGLAHDRHTHYLMAQRLAQDVLGGDVLALLHDLDRASRTWPPLHAVLASLPVALAGVDFRAAPLASSLGWVMAIVATFLTTRRATPAHGTAAGLVAAFFVAASPAHRAFASDIMLESLGAGLVLASLYFFVSFVETRGERAARGFALFLTLLLLHKYNYYALAMVGFGASGLTVVLSAPGGLEWIRRGASRVSNVLDATWRREIRRPTSWMVVLTLGIAAVVATTGGGRFEAFGIRISVTHASNVVYLAYGLVFARGLVWLWRHGGEWIRALSPEVRQLVLWHLMPAAVWFAIPRKLGYFLAYLGGAHTGPQAPSGWAEKLVYPNSFVFDYHSSPDGVAWTASLVALVLVARACSRLRTIGLGGIAIAAFAGTTILLACLHPSTAARYLHPWLATLWVLAGIGAASLIGSGLGVRAARLSAAAVASLIGAYATASVLTAHTLPRDDETLIYSLGAAAFPLESLEKRVAALSNTPAEEFLEWSFVERGGERSRFHTYTPKIRPTRDERRREFERWLERSGAEWLVLIEVSPRSQLHLPGFPAYEELRHFAMQAPGFAEQRVLELEGVTVRFSIIEPIRESVRAGETLRENMNRSAELKGKRPVHDGSRQVPPTIPNRLEP